MPNAAPMGRRLAELREHAAFRQQELAKAIGVSQATISLYERDAVKIPAARIAIAARVMHIPVRRFFEPAGTPLPRLSFRGAEQSVTPKAELWEGRAADEERPRRSPSVKLLREMLAETHSLLTDLKSLLDRKVV